MGGSVHGANRSISYRQIAIISIEDLMIAAFLKSGWTSVALLSKEIKNR